MCWGFWYQIEIKSIWEHVAASDRGCDHQGGRRLVLWQEDGLHIQGQDKVEGDALPLHLGEGHTPPRQQRRRPRKVQVEPPPEIYGADLVSSLFVCSKWNLPVDSANGLVFVFVTLQGAKVRVFMYPSNIWGKIPFAMGKILLVSVWNCMHCLFIETNRFLRVFIVISIFKFVVCLLWIVLLMLCG